MVGEAVRIGVNVWLGMGEGVEDSKGVVVVVSIEVKATGVGWVQLTSKKLTKIR